MIGQTISHYRITEKLGGGGMGVVYKAHDTKLKRTVALKFLPPELTLDADSKERFIHEAQAASALQHNNICTVHDIDETADGKMFIVMDLYEGGTLKKRIERGRLKIEEATDLAIQIAQGLSEAHQHGIVHRDIKPANIMIAKGGVAKIVDFGLAKLSGASKLTKTGSTLGTVAYMPPEQLQGGDVDARADIFSLGVVLYEMLTGKTPFRGVHEAALMYSIVNENPQPLQEIRQDASPELIHIIGRSLEKQVENRYQSLGELIIDLRRLQRDTSRVGSAAYVVTTKAKLSTRKVVLISAAIILSLIALYGIFQLTRKPSAPLQATFTKLTDLPGEEYLPDISPDGKYILYTAYAANNRFDIFLQRIGGSKVINLTADCEDNDGDGTFSPDGQWIAFHSDRQGGGIFIMGSTGESVRRLTDFGASAEWSADGKEIIVSTEDGSNPIERYSTREGKLWAVQVSSGEKRLITEEGDAVQPNCSPHGYRIAYWGVRRQPSRRVISTIPYAGGPSVPVTSDSSINWNPIWSPDGNYLYYISDRGGNMNVWRVPINEKSGEVLGEPEAVTMPSLSTWHLRFSRSGNTFVYVNREIRFGVYRLDFDPMQEKMKGYPEPVLQGTKKLEFISPSPDGEWLAYNQTEGQTDLFVVRKDGSGMRQLTNDSFKESAPAWSPDGKRIAFPSSRSGKMDIWIINVDGSGLQQVTDQVGDILAKPQWFPDGKRLAVFGLKNWNTLIIDLSKPLPLRTLQPLACEDTLIKRFWSTSVSADGNMLVGNVFRAKGVYVYRMNTQKLLKQTESGLWATWLRDNKRFVYSSNYTNILTFDMTSKKSQEIMRLQVGGLRDFSICDDNRRIYYLTRSDESDIWLGTLK